LQGCPYYGHTRSEADLIYAEAFGGECLREGVDTIEDFAEWVAAVAAEDFVGSAVVYYPDDVELPEADIDNEDVGFAVVAGPHTADEWRLERGMLVCPCEVCPMCGSWLKHTRRCADADRPLPGDDCCEVFPSWERFPVEIEWVPRGRRPTFFASGWRHVRFDDDAWSLVVERGR
jgi:hypothetical protein